VLTAIITTGAVKKDILFVRNVRGVELCSLFRWVGSIGYCFVVRLTRTLKYRPEKVKVKYRYVKKKITLLPPENYYHWEYPARRHPFLGGTSDPGRQNVPAYAETSI
jgi:hypothetical protein